MSFGLANAPAYFM
jgi:hypothetical protein